MATMTITRTETQTQGQAQTNEPRRHNRPFTSGVTIEEHDGNAYLDRIPLTETIQSTNPRRIRQLLRLRPNTITRPDGGGSSQVPNQNSRDEPVNILVLELGDIVTQRRLRSVDGLRRYLNRNSHLARRLYLVSPESLSDTVVGLLGTKLELNPDLFALFLSQRDQPLTLSIPSTITARQIVQFNYYRIDNIGALCKERISFSLSQRRQESWTALFLLSDYQLNRKSADILRSNWRETVGDPIPNVFDAMLPSMENSTYIAEGASKTLAAVIHSVFPLMISESAGVLSAFAASAELAKKTIRELSLGNLDRETRLRKIEWLQGALDKGFLRSRACYEELGEALSSMEDAIDNCDILQSRLSRNGNVDVELIRNDLLFLIKQIQRLQSENDILLSKRSSLLAPSNSNNNTPEKGLSEKPRPDGSSSPPGPPPVSMIATSIQSDPGRGGSFPPPGGDETPPSSPPNHESWNQHFSEHIITKIDQIAYMTNILFSLSFIASVYGMNLEIFNGGQVQLSQYLATAIPFAFGVFMVTFFIPPMVTRMLPRKKTRRVVESGFKVDFA